MILLSEDDGVAVLTLNRPASLNAMSGPMVQALRARLVALQGRTDLRAVVVTSAGRAFSAGGDLLEFEALLTRGKDALLDVLRFNQDVVGMVEDLPMPVIGAVNGAAVAGGLELLLCCDILIAARGAKIGDGHARYGVVPAAGASVRLTERIGPARAARLFFTGATVDAERLAGWGLIDEVVEPGDLMPRALALAKEIALASPEAVRAIKRLVHPNRRDPGRQARLDAEIDAFRNHLDGNDFRRGLAAFREKRPPQY